jgi:medium-chain acyl-[acyl-carrier-protein] hydrolase
MRLIRADAAMYRKYIYSEESPLDCRICAYGGVDDANVRREHLEAWKEQTTGSFAVRMFAGGHFFLETAREELIRALGEDLNYS